MSVTYLHKCDGDTARELADKIDTDEITHMVMAYRTKDGDFHYRLVGEKDLTYLIGMMARVQTHMHCIDSFDIPGVNT